MKREVVIIINDIRSAHNVGSIFRSAEGLGVKSIIISGYSPYPIWDSDQRLPHLANKIDKQINKTALGSHNNINWVYDNRSIVAIIDDLEAKGYQILALEQDDKSIDITSAKITTKVALIIGNEVNGIDQKILDRCSSIIEIAMPGKKESLNVSCATAIAIYRLIFLP